MRLSEHSGRPQTVSAASPHRLGTFTTIPSWVLRAITTTAGVSADGFSSRCGVYGGTKT